MKAFIALVHREFIEHRGAFRVAPIILLGILTLIVVSALVFRPNAVTMVGFVGISASVSEIGFAAFAWLWWVYLLCVLVLYFPESFSADKRSNAMLFWKSMPQSDFRILLAKFTAGLTVLPFCILVAAMATGIVLYTVVGIGTATIAGAGSLSPDLLTNVASYLKISAGVAVFFVVGLLWLAPFFAWAGALGAAFGRWAVPLGFFIPGVVGLGEFLVLGTRHFVDWLLWRANFATNFEQFSNDAVSDQKFELSAFVAGVWRQVDPLALVAGLIFAVVVIYVASEYRRRVNDN